MNFFSIWFLRLIQKMIKSDQVIILQARNLIFTILVNWLTLQWPQSIQYCINTFKFIAIFCCSLNWYTIDYVYIAKNNIHPENLMKKAHLVIFHDKWHFKDWEWKGKYINCYNQLIVINKKHLKINQSIFLIILIIINYLGVSWFLLLSI